MVDLIENGQNVLVNNGNKLRYLDALAQYRLASRVKDELSAFLKGFDDLVPDQLLCMFDENELEVSFPTFLCVFKKALKWLFLGIIKHV